MTRKVEIFAEYGTDADDALRNWQQIDGPVTVALEFVLPRPKSAPKTRTPAATKRPDVDKLARAILDAITGICVADDAQVTHLCAKKRLGEIGETPGVHIRIEQEQ